MVILRMDGTLKESTVVVSELGEWFVRQENLHTFQAVYRAPDDTAASRREHLEDDTEMVLGQYGSFEEAHWAASEAADEAHLAVLDEEDFCPPVSPSDDLTDLGELFAEVEDGE